MATKQTGMTILHAGLIGGLLLVAAVFVYRSLTIGPSFVGAPMIGYVTAAFGFASLAVATAFLLPRIPRRSANEAPDEYWSRNEVRMAAIIVWALIEGPGVVALVGYFLSGGVAPAIVAGLAIVALVLARPARIEGDGT
jgi:hypothetical protein